MTNASAGQHAVDDYLRKVRAGLRSLPEAQASEFIEELRSHVHDRARAEGELTEASVLSALDSLGRPQDLAAMYLAENIVARAQGSFSPWLILKGVFRWAALSSAGVFVLLGSLVGYALAAGFTLCALRKPFAPGRVGLWQTGPDNFSLTLGFDAPPLGNELLGWWIVPLGLLMGTGLFLLTARLGLWGLRRFHRLSPLHLH